MFDHRHVAVRWDAMIGDKRSKGRGRGRHYTGHRKEDEGREADAAGADGSADEYPSSSSDTPVTAGQQKTKKKEDERRHGDV